MNELIEWVTRAVLIGAGATVLMDLWGLLQKHVLKNPPLDYRFLGRWIGSLPRGRFVHENIRQSPPVRGELALGWSAHYLIGISFAGLLLIVSDVGWARQPTLLIALVIGWATVVAPFFILQPAMGAGIASSKTPHPNRARLRSLVTHTVYGLGLYLAAEFWAWAIPLSHSE